MLIDSTKFAVNVVANKHIFVVYIFSSSPCAFNLESNLSFSARVWRDPCCFRFYSPQVCSVVWSGCTRPVTGRKPFRPFEVLETPIGVDPQHRTLAARERYIHSRKLPRFPQKRSGNMALIITPKDRESYALPMVPPER